MSRGPVILPTLLPTLLHCRAHHCSRCTLSEGLLLLLDMEGGVIIVAVVIVERVKGENKQQTTMFAIIDCYRQQTFFSLKFRYIVFVMII